MAAKFLKTYLVFLACAAAINLPLEVIFTPEFNATGVMIFYVLFSIPGALISLKKSYEPKRMGILSLILGFIFEFTFMRPDWVQNIFALQIEMGVIVAVMISALYWFIAWGAPSYVIARWFSRE